MEPRLAAEIWVQAHMRRLSVADIPAFVVARGDPVAGAILVKVNRLDGTARLFQRMSDMEGRMRWVEILSDEERAVDEAIERQRARDRDLWVIEIEDREGRHFLEDESARREG